MTNQYITISDSFGSGTATTASITGGTMLTFHNSTPSGTEVKLEAPRKPEGINPRLYFRYVKSKLGKLEQDKLAARMAKLKKMVLAAEELQQEALYESLAQLLAVTAREQEAWACGIRQWTERKYVEKFLAAVKDKVVKLDRFEKFPRIPPANIRKKIKAVQEKQLFDEYWVAYVDYTSEKLATNKEKIRNKDPILFGCYAYQPERMYFICDWVDEICDLTLDKMVAKLRLEDREYELGEIPDMDDDYLEQLKEQVTARHKRLADTRSGNFRDNMAEEDTAKAARKRKAKPKTLLQRLLGIKL